MSKKYNVGIVGATGMVGQRFATLLENHPWFNFALQHLQEVQVKPMKKLLVKNGAWIHLFLKI